MNKTKEEVQCLYLRTTGLFNAETPLILPDYCKVRFFDEIEATKFAETMRRRNVIARLSGPNEFYFKKAVEIRGRTIIEIFRVANPDDILETGERIALLIEKLAILSTILFLRRNELHHKLGISINLTSEVNLAVTSRFKSVRARSRRAPSIEGISIDKQFCNRFKKTGFPNLFLYCQSDNDLAKRVQVSADWLHESRREPKLSASVVKTTIALESLLIFSESESLARSLSERVAFILSNSPDIRQEISRIILRFYDVRSGVVHGSQKKAKKLTPPLMESVDRLTLLLHLVISANLDLWPSLETLRLWCESQRWGKPSSDVKYPFTKSYLTKALTLAASDMGRLPS